MGTYIFADLLPNDALSGLAQPHVAHTYRHLVTIQLNDRVSHLDF